MHEQEVDTPMQETTQVMQTQIGTGPLHSPSTSQWHQETKVIQPAHPRSQKTYSLLLGELCLQSERNPNGNARFETDTLLNLQIWSTEFGGCQGETVGRAQATAGQVCTYSSHN